MNKILVGIDGSPEALAALRWAMNEAAIHGAQLEAVLVWSLLDQYHPNNKDGFDPNYDDVAARAALTTWIDAAAGVDHDIATKVVLDLPAQGLLDAGRDADLIVVGGRGTGGFEGLLLGSTTDRVTQLADQPVAVVRDFSPPQTGRVVVGVDGSSRSLHALRWAAAEARARDTDLDVVHAWRLPPMSSPPIHTPATTWEDLARSGEAVLEDALHDPALAGTRVNPVLTNGNTVHSLLERSTGAALLVVGTRGRGRVTGALLGSVSRQVLHHATTPVVII